MFSLQFDRAPIACALFLAMTLAACSSENTSPDAPEPSAPEEYLGLTEPEDGFWVKSIGRDIPPGADEEYCEVAELPGDPDDVYTVGRVEFANGEQSHHLIVNAAVFGSPADAALRELEIGDQVPCLSAESAFGADGMEGVGGIQQRYGDLDYPAGVGREYHGGQRIVFDYHYYNTTTEPIPARSAVSFHLAEPSTVEHLARGFGFTNWLIDTPPGQSKSFTAECRFVDDVMVAGLTRHTHRWGADYKVWIAGGERDGEHLWTSTDFQHEVDYVFDEPTLFEAGEGFRFQCDFVNTEEHSLRFGVNATDEMCILFGLIWNAGEERDVPSQSCDIVFTDEDGIGRAPQDGVFPKPTAEEAQVCIDGSGAAGDECTTCLCNNCGHALIRCAADADCGPILQCVQNTPDDCQAVLDEHSSGIGLLQQMQICIESNACTACDAAESN